MLVTSTCLGLLLGFASPPRSASVSGRVLLPNGAGAAMAVVSLEGSAKSQPGKDTLMDQRGKQFLPHVLAVTVGTVVTFPNSDTVFHNVFAHFHAKRFDLGMYPQGSSKRQRFDKPGLVALFCNVHSEMSAFIMVLDTPYFAVTDKEGKFTITGVEMGQYTAKVWHESGAVFSQRLTVDDGRESLQLKLARR